MSNRYFRVRVDVEWGDWQAPVGKVQSHIGHGETFSMPLSGSQLQHLIEDAAKTLGFSVAEAVHIREMDMKDVLQPKQYGPKPQVFSFSSGVIA